MSEPRTDARSRPRPEATATRGGRTRISFGLAVLFALVPSLLAASGALRIQVVAAAAGALLATTGAVLGTVSWPKRRQSEVHHLLFAVGFFLLCAGVVGMLAGIGLYH